MGEGAGGPSLEGVGDNPDGPDVDGVFSAGLDGDDLKLSEGLVLRVQVQGLVFSWLYNGMILDLHIVLMCSSLGASASLGLASR